MRALVVGAKGFVGAALVRELLASGHEVVALEPRLGPGRLVDVASEIEWVVGDGASGEGLLRAIGRRGADAIYYGPYYRNPPGQRGIERELEVMAIAAWRVFALAHALPVRRIVFPSSTAVHGVQPDDGSPVNEQSRLLPNTLYGAYKIVCEHVGGEVDAELGENVIASIRLPSIYGPGAEIASRRVNVPAVSAARGQSGRVDYVPQAHVCIAHVQDCARALVRAMDARKLAHHVYELGGLNVSFGQIAASVQEIVPDAQTVFGSEERSILPYDVDGSRMRDELGVEHRDLRSGMASIVEYERALAPSQAQA